MNIWIICAILVALLATKNQASNEDENFCEKKAHYNSLTITCCAMKKFDAPAALNPFEQNDKVKACLKKNDDIKSGKNNLSKKLWLLYKCLLEEIPGDVTISSFTDFMVKRFQSDSSVQTAIKASVEKIKKELPGKSQRRKRSFRMKRDAEDEGSTESEESTTIAPAAGESGDENPQKDNNENENTSTETSKVEGNEESTSTEIPNGIETTTGAPENKDGSEENESKKNEEKPNKEPRTLTTYDRLSVFEYFESFKNAVPNEDLLRIWDVYYAAEFEACHTLAKHNDTVIHSYSSSRCLSWIQSTARRGGCCDAIPIPFPLLQDPPFDRESIQNFTVKELMPLAGGDYTWTNYTYSSNVQRCRSLAVAAMMNYVDVKDLKNEVDAFFARNVTEKFDYDYERAARRLIPQFYSEDLRNEILNQILPKFDRGDKNAPKDQYYGMLQKDSDIEKIKNVNNTEYVWASPHEWENLQTNKARYLMWSCDAYRMISQRIKYFDFSSFCY